MTKTNAIISLALVIIGLLLVATAMATSYQTGNPLPLYTGYTASSPDSNGQLASTGYVLNAYSPQKTTLDARGWQFGSNGSECFDAEKVKCEKIDPASCQTLLYVYIQTPPPPHSNDWAIVTAKHTYRAICPTCFAAKQLFYTSTYDLYANQSGFDGVYSVTTPCTYGANQAWED